MLLNFTKRFVDSVILFLFLSIRNFRKLNQVFPDVKFVLLAAKFDQICGFYALFLSLFPIWNLRKLNREFPDVIFEMRRKNCKILNCECIKMSVVFWLGISVAGNNVWNKRTGKNLVVTVCLIFFSFRETDLEEVLVLQTAPTTGTNPVQGFQNLLKHLPNIYGAVNWSRTASVKKPQKLSPLSWFLSKKTKEKILFL